MQTCSEFRERQVWEYQEQPITSHPAWSILASTVLNNHFERMSPFFWIQRLRLSKHAIAWVVFFRDHCKSYPLAITLIPFTGDRLVFCNPSDDVLLSFVQSKLSSPTYQALVFPSSSDRMTDRKDPSAMHVIARSTASDGPEIRVGPPRGENPS